jgi:hypothetical protein
VLNITIIIGNPSGKYMKHKLKLSFWALGILVLVLSNLFVFAPAPQASAASLSIGAITDQTYKYSIYNTWRTCLSNYDGSYIVTDLAMNFIIGTTPKPYVLGFAGSDGGNSDGLVYCSEAGKLWMSIAGYSDAKSMMSDLGFNSADAVCQGVCTRSGEVDYTLKNGVKASDLPGKLEGIAKSKDIPTSLPKWGRYILGSTALEAKCQVTGVGTGGMKQDSEATMSVKIVSNDAGTVTSKTYHSSSDEGVAAFPGPSGNADGGNKASCDYLGKDVTTNATDFSAALVEDRINTTISIVEQAACDQLGFTSDNSRARDSCLKDFRTFAQECIDDYYKGNAHANPISRTEPFDTTVVSICMENKAKEKKYNITAETLAGILGDAQNQTTPDTTATPGNTDPCAVLGNDVPMRWLACALLTAGSGMAATFYNMVQQLLYMPTSSVFNDSFNKTAQSFRIIGMALIIIAGLVMIIAQATGSDLVDAYTIKKVLPKLGMALVGMAISLPLLKFAVNLTNDVGIAAGNIIVNLGGANAAGNSATIGDNISALFLGLAGVAIAGFTWGWAAITFVGTAALALLIGVVVLAIRQMAIVVLIMIAPLAIAASVLPGTDKLWKFWRTTLFSTLMMFPILMMFLKAGEFMAGIFGTMADDQNNELFTVLAALIYFAPYFMIPLAFKMAGGLISTVFGMMNDRGKGLFDGLRNVRDNQRKQRMSHYGGIVGGRALQARYRAWNGLKSSNGVGARIARRAIGGFNIEAEMSAYNAKYQDAMDKQIATGPDDLIRAYSVNKAYAKQGGMEGEAREDGHTYSNSGLYRKNKNGTNEYRTLGGAWVKESMVDDSHHAFGSHNLAAYQKSLAYEMQKGITQEQQDDIVANYGGLSRANGMSSSETNEVWKGAAFAKQNENRQWKHYGYDKDIGEMRVNGLNLMREIDEKQGNYAMSMQNADTWTTMSQEMVNAAEVYESLNGIGPLSTDQTVALKDAQETLTRGARIAHATASASMAEVPDADGARVPVGGRQVGAGAPARTMQEMDAFVKIAADAASRTVGTYVPPVDAADAASRALDNRGRATEVPTSGYGPEYQPAERPSTSPSHQDRGPDSKNQP